ncbi:MAG: hypothetical protein SGBAC_008956 [Bacillariaceae sp.]
MNWGRNRSKSRSKKRGNSKGRKKADKEAQQRLEEAKARARAHRNFKEFENTVVVNSSEISDNGNDGQLNLNASVPTKNRNRVRTRNTRPDKKSSMKQEDTNGKSRPRRRRCSSITFCEQLEVVKDIVPVRDMVDDKRQLWWNSTEYQQMVELSFATVNLAKVDKTTYTRGLEDLLKTDHAATHKTRNDVLLAQNILRRKDVQDEEALSGLYGRSTAKYTQEAERRAKQDAKEVQTYLADTRRQVRRTWSV